jgi:hypothetical protein
MITISVETDEEERAVKQAFRDGTLLRAIPDAFRVKRDGRDLAGASARLRGIGWEPRETYISADPPLGTFIVYEDGRPTTWAPIPADCPVTGWPQIDRPDLDMCSCGHRHITITCWAGGGPPENRDPGQDVPV